MLWAVSTPINRNKAARVTSFFTKGNLTRMRGSLSDVTRVKRIYRVDVDLILRPFQARYSHVYAYRGFRFSLKTYGKLVRNAN